MVLASDAIASLLIVASINMTLLTPGYGSEFLSYQNTRAAAFGRGEKEAHRDEGKTVHCVLDECFSFL